MDSDNDNNNERESDRLADPLLGNEGIVSALTPAGRQFDEFILWQRFSLMALKVIYLLH
jgi:hypothetical protein